MLLLVFPLLSWTSGPVATHCIKVVTLLDEAGILDEMLRMTTLLNTVPPPSRSLLLFAMPTLSKKSWKLSNYGKDSTFLLVILLRLRFRPSPFLPQVITALLDVVLCANRLNTWPVIIRPILLHRLLLLRHVIPSPILAIRPALLAMIAHHAQDAALVIQAIVMLHASFNGAIVPTMQRPLLITLLQCQMPARIPYLLILSK